MFYDFCGFSMILAFVASEKRCVTIHVSTYKRSTVVVRPSKSKMTMTSGSSLSLFVCPEVADKANPGVEPASTGVAHVTSLVLCPFASVAFLWLL